MDIRERVQQDDNEQSNPIHDKIEELKEKNKEILSPIKPPVRRWVRLRYKYNVCKCGGGNSTAELYRQVPFDSELRNGDMVPNNTWLSGDFVPDVHTVDDRVYNEIMDSVENWS